MIGPRFVADGRLLRWPPTLLLTLGLATAAGSAVADPVVPGFDVEVYSPVTDPQKLSFDAFGNLFVGRDNSGSGGDFGDPVKIHRIAAGGGPVAEYGNTTIVDPDCVVVDDTGVFGTPGAVLAGGIVSNLLGGHVVQVLPNENVVGLFGPTPAFHNPSDFVFDGAGRLLFTNHANPGTSVQGVYVSTGPGDTPGLLFATSSNVVGIAVDASDRIYVGTDDGRIERRASDGSLLDPSFVQGVGLGAGFTIGAFEGETPALYVATTLGELLQVDLDTGNETLLGDGFVSVADLAFGVDEKLYASEFTNDRVLMLPEPRAALALPTAALLLAAAPRSRRRNSGPTRSGSPSARLRSPSAAGPGRALRGDAPGDSGARPPRASRAAPTR